MRRRGGRRPSRRGPSALIRDADASLLDLVDHLLTRGLFVTGDVVLGLADVDLIYLRLSVLLAAADRVLEGASGRRRRPTGTVPPTSAPGARRMGPR